ncbi:MAG: LPXTG cell wall anchor domain-containing protein [Clostridia bacterium]|nr:LPXTG cell wall anchor domain-containing protein [Clostridia bacterium]
MKKFISVFFAVLFVVLSAVSVSAATRKDVLDLAKETIPAEYNTYHIWAENILGQYDLSEEEWDEVLALLKETAAVFTEDNGKSLHQYTGDKQKFALSVLDKFCEITGSTYIVRTAANPKHKGDNEVLLYKADGALVALIDGDLTPDTTGEADGTLWLVLSATLITLAGAAFFVVRRRESNVA